MAAAVHEAMLALSPQPGEREFHCTLQSLRVRFSSQTAADLFARADADCDGVLTPDELARWGLTYPRMLQTLHYRLTDVRGEAAADEEAKAAARRCDDMRQALATATADEEAARQAVGAVEAALAAEIKEVERLRAVQEQRRALEHGDPNDVLSEEQGQRIAAALLQAGAGPADRYDRHYASASAHDVKAFASRLEAEWGRKGGDVVDELMANLCAPKGTPVPQKLTMLAEAARLLHDGKSAMYPGRSRVELLVLALYTMAGPDIDALMGYQDAPAAYDPKQQDDWQQYCDRHPDRNKAIFSTINWAVRTAADPQQPPESVDDAWTVVRRWTKFIALLLATCAQPEPMAGPRGRDVFRGLAGLPGNVHAAHKAMEKGAELHWPSASSCALLRRVSEDYIAGRAANATRQDGGAVLFLVSAARLGVLLKSISKYPDEDEMLLPPLSAFRVQDVQQGETAAGGDDEAAAVLSLTFTGCSAPEQFVGSVLQTEHQSAVRLQSVLARQAAEEVRQSRQTFEAASREQQSAAAAVAHLAADEQRQQDELRTARHAASRAAAEAEELAEQLRRKHEEAAMLAGAAEAADAALAKTQQRCVGAGEKLSAARDRVAAAGAALDEAEQRLRAVLAAVEERRTYVQTRVSEAVETVRVSECGCQRLEEQLRAARAAAEGAKQLCDRLQGAVVDAEATAERRRTAVERLRAARGQRDEEEQQLLEQEVRLVELRESLDAKERKHEGDVERLSFCYRPPAAQRASPCQRRPSPPGTRVSPSAPQPVWRSSPLPARAGAAVRQQSPAPLRQHSPAPLRHHSPAPSLRQHSPASQALQHQSPALRHQSPIRAQRHSSPMPSPLRQPPPPLRQPPGRQQSPVRAAASRPTAPLPRKLLLFRETPPPPSPRSVGGPRVIPAVAPPPPGRPSPHAATQRRNAHSSSGLFR
eukprot:TRINITY_DN3966_c0_g3_i1.p1 TRINITY_DN3966_c0_g3~~TRINITY_DN3966_c0_g3_i1.p1  ORF type:complete len:973 (+),score=377.00 TRINITY_DN3966_c0_g3_i1:122-2920(+)